VLRFPELGHLPADRGAELLELLLAFRIEGIEAAARTRHAEGILGVFEVRGLLDFLQAQLLGQFILG